MIENENIPCRTCALARRSPSGYVEACDAIEGAAISVKYGRCVEASVRGKCAEHVPAAGKKIDATLKPHRI